MANAWGRSWSGAWATSWGGQHAAWACTWQRSWLDAWGDTSSCVAVVEVEPEVTSGGISWKLYRDYYRDYLRKEKALEALPEPVRKTIERAERGILKPIQFNPQAPSLPPSGRSKVQIERELKALEKAKRQKAKEQYAILLLELVQIELYYEWVNKRRYDELALLLLIS